MKLKTVRLELGRTGEFPEGSPNHGYELVVPLTDDGRIDLDGWRETPQTCTVLRFWGGDRDQRGQLIRTADGGWAFSYVPGEEDDEVIFRFADHVFRESEYVTVTETDGTALPFRVAWVDDWRPGD